MQQPPELLTVEDRTGSNVERTADVKNRSLTERVMLAVFDALSVHTGVADILYTRTSTHDLREHLFGLLHDAGFDAQQTVDGLSAILTYVVGAARHAATAHQENESDEAGRLRQLLPERYPTLTAIADEYPKRSSRRAFELGRDLILDGLETQRPTL